MEGLDPSLMMAATRGPQLEPPGEVAARIQQMQAAHQQQQMGALQLQTVQMENQARQRDLNDSQILQHAYTAAAGDMSRMPGIASQMGASPKAVMSLQSQAVERELKRAETAKNSAQAATDNASAAEKQNSMISQGTGYLKQLPTAEQRAAAWPTVRTHLLNEGHIDPAKVPDTYPGDQWLEDAHGVATTQAQSDAAAKAQREAQMFTSQLAASVADAKTKTTEAAQVDKFGMPLQAFNAQTETARHNKVDEGQGTQRLGFEKQRVGLEGQRNQLEQKKFNATLGAGLDANGKPLSDEERKAIAMQDPTAVAMANYQIPPPNRTSLIGNTMYGKVLSIDKTYDGTKFQGRNKTAQAFTAAGPEGQKLTSTDTALAHLDRISRAGQALKNGDTVWLNKIANEMGYQFGGSAQNIYDGIVSMVAPEISRAVIGGEGGEGERNKMAHNFSSQVNDQTREGTIKAAADLLYQRTQKQAHAYEYDMGKPLDLSKRLSPGAQNVIQRYGLKSDGAGGSGQAAGGQQHSGGVPVTAGGKVYTFPNQAAADEFKKAAGIQ